MFELGDIVNLCDRDGQIRRGSLANPGRDADGAVIGPDCFDINVFMIPGDALYVRGENRLNHGVCAFKRATSSAEQHEPGHWWP